MAIDMIKRIKVYAGLPVLVAVVILLILFCGQSLLQSPELSRSRVVSIDSEYAADFSNDAILVGASHNIFVGKVIAKSGTKERGIGPETQFQVEVVENIKGDLQGVVTVNQQGGTSNGVLYIVNGDTLSSTNYAQTYMLEPGATYLFATRYSPEEAWYTLNPYPTARKALSFNPSITDTQIRELADIDPRVNQLKAVYPNEVLLDADVKHNNTPNSYVSVQAKIAAGKPIIDDTQQSSAQHSSVPVNSEPSPDGSI
jgi:hypothetical protein